MIILFVIVVANPRKALLSSMVSMRVNKISLMLDNYKLAINSGSPGCCNSECLAKAETDGLKLRSGRRIDSTKSSVSLRSVSLCMFILMTYTR